MCAGGKKGRFHLFYYVNHPIYHSDRRRHIAIGEAFEHQKKSLGASDGFRGNRYTAQKNMLGDNKQQDFLVKGQNSLLLEKENVNKHENKKTTTRERIAKQHGIGEGVVQRSSELVQSLKIADEQRALLIGEAYRAQKMSKGGQTGNTNAKKRIDQKDPFVSELGKVGSDEECNAEKFPNTAAKIAHDFGVGEATPKRAEQYISF